MKKFFAICLSVFIVVSLAAGCGSGGKESQDLPTTMIIGTSQSCTTLDPANGYDYWYLLRYGVGETLMKFGEDMTPEPWLAESYPTVSDDRLTWTVVLRDDINFSNGEKVTAQKALECIQRQYQESGPAKTYFGLGDIRADGQVLTITTVSPVPIMPYILADPVFVIYDTADLTDVQDKGPLGTGPFVFSEFDSVTRNCTVVRNDNYWGGDVVLESIEFRHIPEASTLTMSLQNGDVDAAYSITIEDIAKFSDDPDYTVLTSASGRTTFGFMNQAKGHVLSDEVLRQAVIRIVDRQTYCTSLFYDQFIPGKTPLTSSLPYGYDELNDINAYDPEGAAALLDEAGYVDKDGDGYRELPDGSYLEIPIIMYQGRVEIPLIADAMMIAGRDIGLRFKIVASDSSAAWNMLISGEYDILLMSISMASSGDPENGLKSYFRSYSEDKPNYNMSGYSNPKVDALFDELSVEFDAERRIEIVKEIEQILMDDSACIYFCYPMMNFVTKSNVTGVTSHTSDYYWITKDTGFTK